MNIHSATQIHPVDFFGAKKAALVSRFFHDRIFHNCAQKQ
jgi:hypothetical protein